MVRELVISRVVKRKDERCFSSSGYATSENIYRGMGNRIIFIRDPGNILLER